MAIEKRWGVRLPEIEPEERAEDEDETSKDLPRQPLLYFDHMDSNWTTVRAWGSRLPLSCGR